TWSETHMRLQLAIDTQTLSEAEALVSRVRDLVDLVEVGTPLVIREGVGAVRRLRAVFPDLTLVADLKIVDVGHFEATLGFEAGARLVALLAAATAPAVAALRPDLVVVGSAIARAADPRAAATALRRALGEERP